MQKKKRTYSFDIFDTCLVRSCGTPDNMFEVLSKKVFNKEVSETERQNFVVARKTAEVNYWSARQTLSDIYQAFSYKHPYLPDANELLHIELECERMLLRPVATIQRQIDSLRKFNNTGGGG